MGVVSTGQIALSFQSQTGTFNPSWTNTGNLASVDGSGASITMGPSDSASKKLNFLVPATAIQGEPVGIILRAIFLSSTLPDHLIEFDGPASTSEQAPEAISGAVTATIGTSSSIPTGAAGLTGSLIRGGTGGIGATVIAPNDLGSGTAVLDAVTIEIYYNASTAKRRVMKKILKIFGGRLETLFSTFFRNILTPGIQTSRRSPDPVRALAVAIEL